MLCTHTHTYNNTRYVHTWINNPISSRTRRVESSLFCQLINANQRGPFRKHRAIVQVVEKGFRRCVATNTAFAKPRVFFEYVYFIYIHTYCSTVVKVHRIEECNHLIMNRRGFLVETIRRGVAFLGDVSTFSDATTERAFITLYVASITYTHTHTLY